MAGLLALSLSADRVESSSNDVTFFLSYSSFLQQQTLPPQQQKKKKKKKWKLDNSIQSGGRESHKGMAIVIL